MNETLKEFVMKKGQNVRRRMTAEELEEVKQNLLKRKSELWQAISEDIEDDAREGYQELVESIRDGSDRAMAEFEETTLWSYVKLKVREIENIEEALKRMETGKYGSCRSCGGWIRPDRLKVVPYAVRCRACQEKLEKIGRA
jgi:DnaK suppressor protein